MMTMRACFWVFGIALLTCSPADSRASEGKNGSPSAPAERATAVIEAVPVHEATALKLDGALTDEVWSRAPKVEGFVQREPNEGAAPTFNTEARVAYDAAHIYVAVTAHDPDPSQIRGFLTRRDTQSPSDWLSVVIDSYHDRRTAFEFKVNPAGVKMDTYYFNDGNEDRNWDAVWDVAVSHQPTGWTAEFRIPLSQLRFPPSARPTFGFALLRQVARLNEGSTWPLIARSVNGFVSQFGELRGLELSAPPKKLELLPYTVGEISTEPNTNNNPFVDSVNPGASFGLDMKYALTPGLTLTATINPDFGQVEADPAVVNLSAFETFFPERRPFFVEGSGVFRFDMDCNDGSCTGLFYTRRIGRPPQLSANAPDEGFVSSPVNTTIYGATKVTGRIGGFSLGVLNALTAEENAILGVTSRESTSPIEPFSSYTVGRLRREFANQSSIGGMFTATNRNVGDERNPMRLLAGSAYTGGMDVDWRVGSRYAIAGYWAASGIQGTEAAIARLQENNVHSYQRPDATHVEFDPTRTTLAGQSGSVAFRKISGAKVRFESNASFKTPGFDSNDLGFIRRADIINQSNWLQWRDDKPGKYLRTFRFNLNQWSSHNFDGDRLNLGFNVNAHWTFTNNWSTGMGVNRGPGSFDDRATRGGPGANYDGSWSVWNYMSTDSRKPVVLDTFLGGGDSEFGSSFFDVNPSLTFRPMSSLSISGGLRYGTYGNDAQWVTNEKSLSAPTHYVFARLDQETIALTTRVNFTMSANLSLQVYAEPFVSAGAYTSFKELVDGRSKDWQTRYAPYDYSGNPDFNYRSFRTTNVLRWEYRPGSTLFVVWQQGREDNASYGNFRFQRDFGGVFSVPASNVFLVKMSYWLNY